MKRLVVGMFIVSMAHAANAVFISQNGAGTQDGSSCGNAKPVSYFNTSGNWNATPTGIQIGPGTTVHLCGTFTGTAGSTMLTVQGDGAAGNPVIVLWETGAQLTAPFWAGNPGGAINTGTHSHLVFDGQNPNNTQNLGQIVCTANGTQLANQMSTYGFGSTGSAATIGANGTDVTIKNLAMLNFYVRTGNGNELPDTSVVQNIDLWQTNTTIDNITVDGSGWSVFVQDDNGIVRNSTFRHTCHGVNPNGAHWYVYNNHFYDSGVWDDNIQNSCHEDFIHCYAGRTVYGAVYNNRFDGNWGTHFNQAVFLENGGSRCFVNSVDPPTQNGQGTGHADVFNNLLIGNGSGSNYGMAPQGNSSYTNTGGLVANNLLISNSVGSSNGPQGLIIQQIPNSNCPTCSIKVENNAATGFGNGVNMTTSANDTVNFNAYENCSSVGGCYIQDGNPNGFSTLASWRAASSYDANSIANEGAAANAFFKLNSACVAGSLNASCAPTSSSPLLAAGANLFSTCNGQPNPGLGALCFDINGNPRPSSGNWDIGPYQGSGGGPGPLTYTFTVIATDSLSLMSAPKTLSITVQPGAIAPVSLGPWTNGQTISMQLTCAGCAAATWAVSAGPLPTGLSINSATGVISGTITAAGTFSPTITFGSVQQSYSGPNAILVNQTPAITTINLPSGGLGIPYSATIQATGGTGALTFSLITGILPNGLGLNTSTGNISGTPTIANNFPFSIRVVDANGVKNTQDQNLSITINSNCQITPTSLAFLARQTVNTQFVATGCASSTFTISAGSLAGSGLSLSPSGLLSGTAVAGTYNFTVQYDIGTDPIIFLIGKSVVPGAQLNNGSKAIGKVVMH